MSCSKGGGINEKVRDVFKTGVQTGGLVLFGYVQKKVLFQDMGEEGMSLVQLIVNKEYENLVPPLSHDEYNQLKQSIRENGLWHPIIVNESNVILDGHHRFKICVELQKEPEIKIKTFQDKNDEVIFVGESNLKRRQLDNTQRFELGEKLEPYYAERSRKRQVEEGKKAGRGKKKTLLSNESKDNRNEQTTTAQTAKAVGLSRTTYERLREIKQKAPEIYEDVKAKKTSIAHAYTKLKTDTRHKKMVELPQGTFNVVLADPPWKYDVFLRGTPERHYDVMELEQLQNLKIPFAKDCILFLWVTNPKVPDAIQLLESWGFEYKTNMVWVKDKIGTGYYCRSQHELLFVAKRGNPPVPREGDRPKSAIVSARSTHSKKPEIVYELVEKMYPEGRYLELFARNTRKGWKSWGNEL